MNTRSTMDRPTAVAAARQVADAVLYEGYVLYPYRASGQKNRMRWQWGVLVPHSCSAAAGEQWDARTECLLEPRSEECEVAITLRFLQIRQRTVYRRSGSRFTRVDSLDLPERQLVPWQEGVEQEVETTLPLRALRSGEQVVPFDVPGGQETEAVRHGDDEVGRLNRRSWALRGRIRVAVAPTPGPYGAIRLQVTVENRTRAGTTDDREQLMRYAFAGTHAILTVTDGSFLSMADPPEWARPAAAECDNRNTWPVLVGGGRRDVLLSSPIILPDYPEIAPESPGDLYDATEIDEILSLRTLALTDEEKREARGTDPRAAAVIDRVDAMPPEMLDKLHGAIRYLRGPKAPAPPEVPEVPWWDPGQDASVSPETDRIVIAGRSVGNGSRVMLQPGSHRADAQDFFLAGRIATVRAVFHDVDGDDHLAVTLDDDPGAEMAQAHGRYRYFRPDEVTPL